MNIQKLTVIFLAFPLFTFLFSATANGRDLIFPTLTQVNKIVLQHESVADLIKENKIDVSEIDMRKATLRNYSRPGKNKNYVFFSGSFYMDIFHVLALLESTDDEWAVVDVKVLESKIGIDLAFKELVGGYDPEIIVTIHGHAGTGMWDDLTIIYTVEQEGIDEIFRMKTMDHNGPSMIGTTAEWLDVSLTYDNRSLERTEIIVTEHRRKVEMDRDVGLRILSQDFSTSPYVWSKKKRQFVKKESSNKSIQRTRKNTRR